MPSIFDIKLLKSQKVRWMGNFQVAYARWINWTGYNDPSLSNSWGCLDWMMFNRFRNSVLCDFALKNVATCLLVTILWAHDLVCLFFSHSQLPAFPTKNINEIAPATGSPPGHPTSCATSAPEASFSRWKDLIIPGHVDLWRMEALRAANRPLNSRDVLLAFHGRSAENTEAWWKPWTWHGRGNGDETSWTSMGKDFNLSGFFWKGNENECCT